MATNGYPGSYKKGSPIRNLDAASADDDVEIFHAGTALADGQLVANGGRVLGVTALGGSVREAQKKATRPSTRSTGTMVSVAGISTGERWPAIREKTAALSRYA